MTDVRPATFKAAMIQMRSGIAPAANLEACVRMIGEAKSAGADYVQTPEMTNIMEIKRERLFASIVGEEADTSLATLRELARKLAIYVHIGSLAIKLSSERAANRSFLIDPKGDIAARYDKIHMFDVDLADGESYRESRNYRPGEQAVLSDLPWGRLGLTVCYDLRFPALYRALAEAGATMLAIPSAFTQQTGEAHWHALNRARAIENGCYVAAVNRVGKELAEDPVWKEHIIKPPQFLRVDDFAESAIIIKILGETKPIKQWDVTGELRKRLKIAFDKEGIEIPFPQRVIHQAKS